MNPPRPSRRPWGFTLIEIVIVLVIVALLAGLAVPFISGMMKEATLREPLENLTELAKAARLRAIQEGRPYEIVFTETGFSARVLRLYDAPDADRDDAEAPNGEGEGDAESTAQNGRDSQNSAADDGSGDLAAAGESEPWTSPDDSGEKAQPTPLPPLPGYEFTPGIACRLLFWGRSQWVEAGVESAEPERDRWVFQPSGLCTPVRVHFYRDNAWVEAAFNPLTADSQDERYFFPE